MPTSPTHLSSVDLALVALYLVAITVFGLTFARKNKTGNSLKSYFLADNTIPWWAIALSIVSAETSTLTIVSIPGVAFAGNMGFLQVVLGYMSGRIVVALLFLPRYFRGEMLTAYQLIDRRFGPALHKLTAGLFLLTRAAAEGVRVFAISIVVSVAIGTGDTLSIAIISALTLLYTFEGGMAAVIWTDVVQMGLYLVGTVIALFTLGAHVPGGWAHIHAVAAPLGKFHWLDFSFSLTRSYTFWAGLLGGTFLTMASHGTDQLMVQRMLAARNLRESRLALLSSGVVIFLQFTLFLLIGIGLFVFYGTHPQVFRTNDHIFPTFIVQQMPHGIAGLLVAAILAAAMSNLSAALNSLASTTVIDFYVPWKSRATRSLAALNRAFSPAQEPLSMTNSAFSPDKKSVILSEGPRGISRGPQSKDPEGFGPATEAKPTLPQISTPETTTTPLNTNLISRVSTLFWGLILFAIAIYCVHTGGKGHVVETGLSIASVAYGCLLGVFLLGTLTKYATQTGAILGMICGLVTNLILWQHAGPIVIYQGDLMTNMNFNSAPHLIIPKVAFTWYVLIGSAVTFAIGTLFSLVLPRKRAIATAGVLLLLAATNLQAQSQAQPQIRVPQVRGPQGANLLAGVEVSPLRPGFQPTPTSPAATTFDFTEIDGLINAAIAAHKLPGAVVLIGHNGRIVYEHAYGNRKLAGEPGPDGKPSPAEPMTNGTIFDMASLTKVLVTTTAVLQLSEEGKLDLDTPVVHYLPEFAVISSSSTPTEPTPLPQPRLREPDIIRVPRGNNPNFYRYVQDPTQWKAQITVRQLLTHYSGLPEDISLKDDWGLAAPNKAEGIHRALTAIPYGPPGLTFKYSDINFITLGALVEKLSAMTLDEYAHKFIFKSLSMATSGYHLPGCDVGPAPYGHPYQCISSTTGTPPPECLPVNVCVTQDLRVNTAPTAHDDQGTPATNPNFDHLLRGTVHDPTTRRMGGVAGHAGVFSTAEDASRFCDALLAKLLHNTGPFPLKQSTLQMATSPQAPPSAVNTATIFTQDGQTTTGVAQRGLGWDINSPFSRPRGTLFPIAAKQHPGSFGHTGFTGTSLWLDPVSDTYVILLANSVHIPNAASISPLRGQVATAAARALHLDTRSSLDLSTESVILSKASRGLLRDAQSKDPDALSTATAARTAHPRSSIVQPYDPTHPCAPRIICDTFGAPPHTTAAMLSRTGYPVTVSNRAAQIKALKAELEGGYSPSWNAEEPTVLTGIDVLESANFAALLALPLPQSHPLRVALLANQASLDAHGTRTIDLLAHAQGIHLQTIFTPEHGLRAAQDTEHLATETDPETQTPIISLYGPKASDKHPKPSDLKQVDAVVIDLQDVGVRFWTYEAVLGYMLEACAEARVPVVVLDRPNPLAGGPPQGPVSDIGLESYTNFMPLPVRHGLTYGELARYFNARAVQSQQKPDLLNANPTALGDTTQDTRQNPVPPATLPGLHAALTVIPMQGWRRADYFADTHLPWTPPSPNLRTLAATILYPALGLVEQTNVSVGRGTPTPFENLGAAYISPEALATYLTARQIPGIRITPNTLTVAETPEHYPGHGRTIPGIHFEVTDRNAFDSPEFGIELLSALHHLYPKEFQLDRAKTLLASPATLDAIKHNQDPRDVAHTWQPALDAFRAAAKPYLLY